MKKFFDENKKWLLLCLAAVLVVALVVGIVALTGGGEKDPNPTEGTSNVGVTDPTGTTGGNGDNADPTDPEVPDVTDPTGTPENPAKPDNPQKPDDYVEPTEPNVTVPEPTEPEPDETEPTGTPENPAKPDDPQKPDDYTDPSEPDVTVPEPTSPELDPDDTPTVAPDVDDDEGGTEDPVVDPDDVQKPTTDTEYDFGGVTGETIRYEDWASWDAKTRQAFYNEYLTNDTPPEVIHNIHKATTYKDYECGVEGHICRTEGQHEARLEEMAKGCMYCGKSDCVSFFVLNEYDLYHDIDFTKCPEYEITKDPTKYCQDCGLPKSGAADSGDTVCRKVVVDKDCSWCGEPVKAKECHHCIKP